MGDINIKTAGHVGDNNVHQINNYGKPDRKINEDVKEQLKKLLHKDKKVRITAILGEVEAIAFASQIKNYLISAGYNVIGIDQAVYDGDILPQMIRPWEEGDEIIIGRNK